jgi:peroxiredoxin
MKATHLMFGGAAAAAVMVLGYAGLEGARITAAQAADTVASTPKKVDNFRLADQNLQAYDLYRMGDAAAIVLVTQANGCGAVKANVPALKALQAKYAGKGVEIMMLNSNGAKDTREAMMAEAASYGLDMPILMDANQLVGEQLGVSRAAEAIVINPKTWQIAYRGPISDAADAVEAVKSGAVIKVAQKTGEGCPIDFPERAKVATFSQISYSQTIAPMIQEKCAMCHQKGGIGPMELTSYEKIKGFAPMIRETVRTSRMPPYMADPHVGKFSDDKRLSADQIKTLVHWIEAGAPRGAGEDPLAKIKFEAAEWPLGKPDLVLDIPSYKIPATGIVDYQRPYAVNPLTEGRWIRASTMEVNERQAVHHILTGYMDKVPGGPGESNEGKWGASVGQYAVGSESMIWPSNIGTYLPAGGAIGFQNHYTPFGKEVTDRSKLALYFYPKDKTPELMMRNGVIADPSIMIPPGEERHKEVAYLTFPKEALLYSAFPHAHYRGNSAQVDIIYPDGSKKLLLALPKYDFNWQREYTFAEPLKVPAGSKIVATFTFDNSKRNPANPDAKRTVPWGDQSFDEMLYTAIRYRWVDETAAHQLPQYEAALKDSQLLGMLDDNLDGKLQMSELKGQMGAGLKGGFAALDANKDGVLDATELAKAMGMMQGQGRRASN